MVKLSINDAQSSTFRVQFSAKMQEGVFEKKQNVKNHTSASKSGSFISSFSL